MRGEDHFHSAGFTGAVFAVAVLAEVAPFPVAAGEDVVVVVAHGWFWLETWRWIDSGRDCSFGQSLLCRVVSAGLHMHVVRREVFEAIPYGLLVLWYVVMYLQGIFVDVDAVLG